MKSRQEFIPPLGPIIDRIHIEPLHLKNNACALAHRYLLDEVIALSCLSSSVKKISELPSTSPFAKYVTVMKTKCHLSRLGKKVVKWFNDTQADGKKFDYRFTGRESRFFLYNFMYLIDVVEPFAKQGSKRHFTLHALAYFCITLRNCVSLFCRVVITDEDLVELESHCKTLFTLNCLFFAPHRTVWHVGNIVPAHAREMQEKYGMGLALNSMEGREAKHISIARYSRNTCYQNRWEQVFRHEYISLLWLRERGYNLNKPSSVAMHYIPKRATENQIIVIVGWKRHQKSLDANFACTNSDKIYLERLGKFITKLKLFF